VRLTATDRDRSWTLGQDGGIEVRGSAADLLGWLIGRCGGERLDADGPIPNPPRWL